MTWKKQVKELREKWGGWWGEHPDFRVADWAHECGENDTRLGYWEWVQINLIEMMD